MGIAIVITGGLVLMTAFAAGFDYLGKKRKKVDAASDRKVAELEVRITALEGRVAERDERIAHLESDLSFVNRLIEDKSK